MDKMYSTQTPWVFFDMDSWSGIWESVGKKDVFSLSNRLYRISGAANAPCSLWQYFLCRLIILNENPYSLFWERRADIRPEERNDLEVMAAGDYERLYDLFFNGPFFPEDLYDCGHEKKMMDVLLTDHGRKREPLSYSAEIVYGLYRQLKDSRDAAGFQELCRRFYVERGVGEFALHRAFMPDDDSTDELIPVRDLTKVSLDDLVGYESAKEKLVDNTLAFVHGKRANNCLLFGDAGTGKSTSVKALLHRFDREGLRMIEVYKHQFHALAPLMQKLKNRNYRFIIFMDDLSFEEFEIEYKYLKAVIEGGLSKRPDNVLIYATSNRRHLIKENFSDKAALADELHSNDTVQEKLSLVARFGLKIYFGAPEKKEYDEIVRELAKRNHLTMSDEDLMLAAGRFSLRHGGRSGRAASQLIDHLLSDQKI